MTFEQEFEEKSERLAMEALQMIGEGLRWIRETFERGTDADRTRVSQHLMSYAFKLASRSKDVTTEEKNETRDALEQLFKEVRGEPVANGPTTAN